MDATWLTADTQRLHLPIRGCREPAGALAENRLDVAEQQLRSRLQEFPDDAHAMRLLAEVVERRERYDEAENLLRRCLELVPGYSQARYDLAYSLLKQQRPTLVPALIDRLLDADPDNGDYLRLNASYLSFIGQHPRALVIYESQLQTQPKRAATWVQYGHELKAIGRRADSVNAYRQAISLAPKSGAAYWSLANLKTFRFEPAEIEAIRTASAQRESAIRRSRQPGVCAGARAGGPGSVCRIV